jgi:putative SOS response-associated peptidase YedK
MCGRFALIDSGEALAETFELSQAPPVAPRYNIAPTQPVAAVRMTPHRGQDAQQRELALLHWGLIPSWAKDPTMGSRLINARSETAAEKPSFRTAYKYRRCLVPASGFYEWQKVNGRKQPTFIHLQQEGPFAIAGLWEYWQGADGSEIESVTLLTTRANELVQPIHDRMPVIIAPADYALWLDTAAQHPSEVRHLLRPYPAEEMAAYAVSTVVNNPRNEGKACIVPEENN